MINWHDYMVAEERRQDYLTEAKLERMRGSKTPRRMVFTQPSRYEQLLIGLGERLEIWGCQLQTRYRKAILIRTTEAMMVSQGQLLAESNNSSCA